MWLRQRPLMTFVEKTLLYAAGLVWPGGKGIEDEYKGATNKMGKATLGVFQPTSLGIVSAESKLTP